jgi:hypothetical protein
MDLYIGNPRRQDHILAYRMLEQAGGAKMPTIRRGGQFKIPGDLTQPEIEYIVNQHRKYGLLSVDEVGGSRQEVPLIYSVGRPITAAILNSVMKHNTDVLVAKGKELRQQAAVAANNAIENDLRENNVPLGLNELDMSVVEETGNAEPENPVAEGTVVTRLAERMPDAGKTKGIAKGRRNSRGA